MSEFIIEEFGRQKVFPPVKCCIYCGAQDCKLGDEHIIPQALGGNMILPAAACRECERMVGSQLEGHIPRASPSVTIRSRSDRADQVAKLWRRPD
jgi:hypothetical protein